MPKHSQSTDDKPKKNESSRESRTTKSSLVTPEIISEDTFLFWNGDKYNGSFKATKGGSIWREGPGEYLTGDEQEYKGVWESDLLTENVSIYFRDNSCYTGQTKDLSYNGCGTYQLPDSSVLTCMFMNNHPIKTVSLVDPTGHKWQGNAELGKVLLLPVNRFLPTSNAQ